MSDCDRTGFFAPVTLVQDWTREFMADWVQKSHAEGYDQNSIMRSVTGAVSNLYNAEPYVAGMELVQQSKNGSPDAVAAAISNIERLPVKDRMDAACEAYRLSKLERQSNPDLPKITIVTQHENDDTSLAALKVSRLNEIVSRDFK